MTGRTMGPVSLIVAVWVAIGVAAQAPADFSGRWTVAPAPAAARGAPGAGGAPGGTVRGDLGSGWGTEITIAQDAKQLTVETLVYSRNDLQPQPRFVYALDGSESRNTVVMGRGRQEQSSRAAWEGATLRITTAHAFADPVSGKPLTIDVTQKLSLESPTTLVVEVTRGGVLGSRPSTTRTVYSKASP